jgi:hypothetical protein
MSAGSKDDVVIVGAGGQVSFQSGVDIGGGQAARLGDGGCITAETAGNGSRLN